MENTIHLKKIKEEKDLLAEVYLASLPAPPSPKNCAILPLGHFNREVKKDIVGIKEWKQGEEIVYRELSTSRRSIYDILPWGIFHSNQAKLENSSNKKTKEDILAKIQKSRQEEKEARRFFAPFDLEINLWKYLLELEESKVVVGFNEDMYVLFFDALWFDYKSIFNNRQKFQLFHVIPHFWEIIGDTDLTGQCLSLLLELPIIIKSEYYEKKWKTIDNKSIGNATLNKDCFVGDTISETVQKWTIQIGPVSSAVSEQLVLGKQQYNRLLSLVDLLFPLEIIYDIDINVETEKQTFRLSANKPSRTLGYSAYL